MLLPQFQTICRDVCQLEAGKPVLLGVSGGPDSLCLLDLFARLDYPLVVAHFDHGLRPESAAEAKFVEEQARRCGAAFVTRREDVPAYAAEQKLSIEEAARRARYRFLFAEARATGAQAVAVGHNADDQVETVLMHLLRGAGLSGLKGMSYRGRLPEWDPDLPLVRPLLEIWRSQIAAYCQERGLTPLVDASNADTNFFRNRLRHELIPYLKGYNPQIKETVWRMSQSLAGDTEILAQLEEQAWVQCRVEGGPGYLTLDLAAFRALLPGLQRRLLRRLVSRLRSGLRDIDFESIQRGLNFALRPSRSGQVDFIQGLTLLAEEGRMILADWDADLPLAPVPQLTPGQEFWLPVPGEARLRHGWRIRAEISKLDHPLVDFDWEMSPAVALLDVSALQLPLKIRTQRPGERFKPLGMSGHSLKLSDFWVNEHLSRRLRAGWPLVFSGEELAWIPLFRPAHTFRVTETTRRVVKLFLERPA